MSEPESNQDSLINNEIDRTVDADKIMKEIINDLLMDTFIQITCKSYKFNCAVKDQKIVKIALEEILNVYDKPKPCNDHSHIVEAWKRDKPATTSDHDSLVILLAWKLETSSPLKRDQRLEWQPDEKSQVNRNFWII